MRTDRRDSTDGWDWNVAVFCQNERDAIADCLKDIERASDGRRVLVCIVVNGSTDGTAARAVEIARACTFDCQVIRVAAGDKANAINLFNYDLRVPAQAYIYVDGYVRLSPGSFARLAEGLDAHPRVAAVTGVCTNGRTMQRATRQTLQVGGQLHGQLHAFRPSFIDRMVARGIRLPIGIYRGDGLLGTFAAYDLDPMTNQWENTRIKGVAGAQYEIRSLSMFKPGDLRRQFRRMVRQARGRLEVLAIKSIIYKHGLEGLPTHADQMIADYLAEHGKPTVPLAMAPFLALAIRELASPRRWLDADLHGELVFASRPGIIDHVRRSPEVVA